MFLFFGIIEDERVVEMMGRIFGWVVGIFVLSGQEGKELLEGGEGSD